MVPQNFPQKMLDAAIHLLNAILKIVLFPFVTWTKSIVNLAEKKKPIYDPTVGLNLELLYHAVIALAYPLGLLDFVISFFSDKVYKAPFDVVIEWIVITLILVYIAPVLVIVASYLIKFAWTILKGAWVVICSIACKIYNFIVNPHWHIAVKHINKEEK